MATPQRVVLITGASRGLGAALALHLADAATQLVLVARTPGGLEEIDDGVRAAGGQATLVPLDLTDGQAIDRLGAALAERFGRLDAMVGGAAELGALSPIGHIDPDVLTRAMTLNAIANYRLIRSLDPLLRAAPAGRALFVTCRQGFEPAPFWGPYAASKAALEALVMTYAAETRRTAIRVNLVDPGPMRTRLRAQAYPGEDPSELPEPDGPAAALVELLAPECTHHGARIELDAAGETRTKPSRSNPTSG